MIKHILYAHLRLSMLDLVLLCQLELKRFQREHKLKQQQKTSQKAAQSTSHWLTKCQFALTKGFFFLVLSEFNFSVLSEIEF